MRLLGAHGLVVFITVCAITAISGGAASGAGPATRPATAPTLRPKSAAVVHLPFDRCTQAVTQIYFNDFDDTPAGSEWSSTKVSFTDKGDRPYLGDFAPNQEPVKLSLGRLPPHQLVRISFDLFLKRSWDGSSPQWGNTIWDMQLDDGRSLIHTTFCNCGFASNNNEQAFPDTFAARTHPAGTGAAETRTLGAMQSWGSPDTTFDTSSVYHLVLTFPHTSDHIVFKFSSKMQNDLEKYFGLTNVRVEMLSDLARHSDTEFARMWADLGSARYQKFFTAQWDLIASGDAAVAFLSGHMDEVNDLSEREIRDVINEFRKTTGPRPQELIETLVMQGSAATDMIEEALGRDNFSDDQKQILDSCKQLIARYPQSATEVRRQRARQLLQVIHTDAAMKLLAEATTRPIGS